MGSAAYLADSIFRAKRGQSKIGEFHVSVRRSAHQPPVTRQSARPVGNARLDASAQQQALPACGVGTRVPAARIIDALPPFHKMMVLLNHHADRDFAFRCLAAPVIGEDEAVLLGVWQDVATGEVANAEATLAMIADEDAAKVIGRAMLAASNVFSTKGARPLGLANLAAHSQKSLS